MSSKPAPCIVWFRDDLRLADNPALHAAAATGAPVLCLFIHDTQSPGLRPIGAAGRWWLHFSLNALARSLERIGGRLDVYAGAAGPIIDRLVAASGAKAVYWNRRYGGGEIALDSGIKERLTKAGVKVETYKGKLLHEPWEVKKQDGALFRVFTAFWRASRALPDAGEPLPAPARLDSATAAAEPAPIEALGLLPQVDWAAGLREKWTPGEAGAHERLHRFVEAGLTRYGTDRNIPGIESTSKLSPHLRFGEVSPRQLMAAAVSAAGAPGDVDKFLAEIGWREFSYSLLYANPKLATDNIDARFDAFPFRDAPEDELDAWRYGRTGYPIVDAGMRELARTGYMHNRVRMVTASFLIKHMLVDWRVGEAWFWDCLCDADPANNPASWQWVAGSGADAAPYFRIFNPIIQGTKFDPEGAYVRLNVPELARMPDRWIHEPWAAPSAVLRAAGVSIGGNYPAPIVEHPFARQRALDAFAKV